MRFFDSEATDFAQPVDTYPKDVLPLIPQGELEGSRVKIHHPGTVDEPQLFEVELDADLELASHAHESDEIIVVIEGEVRFGSRRCSVGSSVLIPGRTLYSLRAGASGARFLNFRGAADYTYVNREGYRAWRDQGAVTRVDPDFLVDDQSRPLCSRFLVVCSIEERARAQVADRRGEHLAYIRDHLPVIAFGGVIGPPDEPPRGICYALDVGSASAAEAFVAGDPYRSFYSSVRVDPFSQRVPSSRDLIGDDT